MNSDFDLEYEETTDQLREVVELAYKKKLLLAKAMAEKKKEKFLTLANGQKYLGGRIYCH